MRCDPNGCCEGRGRRLRAEMSLVSGSGADSEYGGGGVDAACRLASDAAGVAGVGDDAASLSQHFFSDNE
jgi:hypothetical protein